METKSRAEVCSDDSNALGFLSRKLMRIPKTLIQTARSYEALPAEIKQNIEGLKSRNPGSAT